jgi:integrase
VFHVITEKRYLDIKKNYKATFGELVSKYEQNFKHQASYDSWKRVCIGRFKNEFGEHTLLYNIKYVDLESYRNKLRTTLTSRGTKRKDSTINREISCLHHIFSKAYEWEMIERNPFDRGKSMLMRENNKRDRYLEKEEIQSLLTACPPHLRKIVECVLHTGMRKQEVLGLKWEQERGGFIYLRKTKTNESRQIPINETLTLLFQIIRKEQQMRSQYVFTYAKSEDKLVGSEPVRKRKKLALVPERIDNIKSSFSSAVKRAGIENFTFHDLRHTFTSHFVMAGGSLRALQQILGHNRLKQQ